MYNIRQQIVVFQFVVHRHLLEIDSQSSSVDTSLLENEAIKSFHAGTGRTEFILFTKKMSTLKVFAVTLIEMIRNTENASSKSADNKECHFDRRIRFVFCILQLTYSCLGCALNSRENTVRIVSPTQRPLVNVVNVK